MNSYDFLKKIKNFFQIFTTKYKFCKILTLQQSFRKIVQITKKFLDNFKNRNSNMNVRIHTNLFEFYTNL